MRARLPSPAPARFAPAALFRLAMRDLRGGIAGFAVFLACIAIGVAAIVGVGSLARGLADGLAREGRVILGGDVSVSSVLGEISPEQRRFLQARGVVTMVATQRGMLRLPDGRSTLIDIKAVDPENYPARGQVVMVPPQSVPAALGRADGRFGVAVDPALLARFNLPPGATVLIGDLEVELRATLINEPDKLAGGLGFGPRVLMALDALQATGLMREGSLTRRHYRVILPASATGEEPDERAVAKFMADLKAEFPASSWEARARDNVSPQFSKNLERFAQFLTLVGLTSLVVGGVGIANAAAGFVERKRLTLATLKSFGATGGEAFAFALIQAIAIALIGVAIGLAVGAALPFILVALLEQAIPFPLKAAIYPNELALGLLYGLLVATLFSLAPLARAHDISVSALFRASAASQAGWPRPRYLVMIAVLAALLLSVALGFSFDRRLTLVYALAVLCAFIALRAIAAALMAIARRLPRPRSTPWRLALANIHRPGALTPSVTLSLGLGLALLVALTLIDGNIRNQLRDAKPGKTPSFFFLDLRSVESSAFLAFVAERSPLARIEQTPMLRGRIVAVKGVPAERLRPKDNAAWALEGDRGVTFSATVPAGSKLVAGEWRTASEDGKPFVSLEREVAEGIGAGLGDEITVNVLGRDVTARVGSLREVDWRSFGINFVMVFSPDAFKGAPYTVLATATYPPGTPPAEEFALLKAIGQAYPKVTAIRVRDALDAANEAVSKLSMAIRGAASIALIASTLVLAGALAAGQRSRIYDAVVLKTLGATRARLLYAYVIEYGLIGFATALFGIAAGIAASYAISTRLMKLDFALDWGAAALAAFGALALTIVLGLVGTWRTLGQSPARHLRDL